MKKNISHLREDECYGCSACQHSCKLNAISMQKNREGFWYPVVKEELCMECGRCEKVCPAVNGKDTVNTEEPDVYALWADDSVRMNSASGGAFVMLAEVILEDGGVVCGVVMDEEFQVYHTITDTRNGIEPMRGSKYVQSDIRQVFPAIKTYLQNGRKVLFTGTPCQVAGLKNYIGKDDENLITVDLVCHGPTSQMVFDRYLEDNFGKENVKSFKFRPKAYGHTGLMNETCLKNGKVYAGHRDYDTLQAVLNLNLGLRQTCANCEYAAVPRIGDFTMGDFWGVGAHDPELKSEKGTSVLLVNNEKIKELVERIAKKCKLFVKTPLEAATQKNRFGIKSKEHSGRTRFFEMLPDTYFNKAVKYAMDDRYDVGLVGVWNNLAEESAFIALKSVLNRWMLSVMKIAVNEADDLKKYNDRCDSFVLGSQDIWGRKIYRTHKKNLSLDFVRDEKKKVAIGAWCTEVPQDAGDRMVMRELLKRFDTVLLLDAYNMVNISEEVSDAGKLVLDPVLLAGRETFDLVAKDADNIETDAFLLNYLTVPSKEKIQGAEELAKKLNLKPIHVFEGVQKERFTETNGKILGDITIAQWLRYIMESTYILTDTPHVASLAILYEKQFAFCKRRKNDGSSLSSFFEKLKLEKRMVMNPAEFREKEELLAEIDYSIVNSIIETEKKRDLEWIRKAMFSAKTDAGYQVYDLKLCSEKPEEIRKKYTAIEGRKNKFSSLKDKVAKKLYKA